MVTPQKKHQEEHIVFDRKQIARNRARALKHFTEHDFLFTWARDQITDRLKDINRTFQNCVHLGIRAPVLQTMLPEKIQNLIYMDFLESKKQNLPTLIGDEEILPFAHESLDLVLSNLTLHTINDLPGALIQIKRSLKPDGLFLAAMLGGETLYELRHVLSLTEAKLCGGISPRIFPFADKPQMGALLQRAGFALPVVDSEILTVTCNDIYTLMHDIRGMGEGNAITAREKSNPGRKFFDEANKLYRELYSEKSKKIKATFEIIFLIGWAPHASQQKPLQPGSARKRLSEALETTEFKTGIKP